jgi:hypothetical protein
MRASFRYFSGQGMRAVVIVYSIPGHCICLQPNQSLKGNYEEAFPDPLP